MPTKIVRVFAMRHGEPEKSTPGAGVPQDRLTPLGARQVEAATRQHLNGIRLDAIYFSGMIRAWGSMVAARAVLEQAEFPIMEEEGFGFTWLGPEVPPFDFYATEQALLAKNGPSPRESTVYQWMEAYPPAWAIRGRMIGTLLDVARRAVTATPSKSNYAILAGTHGPTGACAALNPTDMPGLDFADIAKYVIEVEPDRAGGILTCRIVASSHLPAPACD
jgi:broad specificity phosphatase PhoE